MTNDRAMTGLTAAESFMFPRYNSFAAGCCRGDRARRANFRESPAHRSAIRSIRQRCANGARSMPVIRSARHWMERRDGERIFSTAGQEAKMNLPFDVSGPAQQRSGRHNGNSSVADASRTLKILRAGERGRLTGWPDRR